MKGIIVIGLAGLITLGLLFSYISSTSEAIFVDGELGTDNALRCRNAIVTLLNDSFEGSPWDINWDGNGTTNWKNVKDSHSGSDAAKCDKSNNGYLTSDDLNTSAAISITVTFWFRPQNLEAGDILIQVYNGSTYDTLDDLADFPTYQEDQWCYFSKVVTGSQYFISNFRLQLDGSALTDNNEECCVDDVLISFQRQF